MGDALVNGRGNSRADSRVKTLIIAPQWIGDAIMAEPLLRLLHARGERLTVAALPWVAPVFDAMPQVVESVLVLPFAHGGGLQLMARLALARQLRWQRFGAAYVLPNSFKSGLLPFFARIPQRLGYLGEARYGLLTHSLANPGKPGAKPGVKPAAKPSSARGSPLPMVAFYAALADAGKQGVAAAGVLPESAAGLPHPALEVSAEQVRAAQTAFGLQQQLGSYTVFAPGAEYGPAKRWPSDHFAVLADLLGQRVVLLGSAKDFADCQAIADRAAAIADSSAGGANPAQCLNLAGKTTLMQALALIAGSSGVVSNDSGLMHAAAALGVVQVALFGSSSPLHTPPLNPKAVVLWLKTDPGYQPPLDCAPCFARVCPLGPATFMRCLNDIGPAQVLQALQNRQIGQKTA